jgi:PAS domain S-box-containing protein
MVLHSHSMRGADLLRQLDEAVSAVQAWETDGAPDSAQELGDLRSLLREARAELERCYADEKATLERPRAERGRAASAPDSPNPASAENTLPRAVPDTISMEQEPRDGILALERGVQARAAGLDHIVEQLEEAGERLRQQNVELENARFEADTERRRIEAVMEALPVGMAITDAQGGTIHSNKAYEEIWGEPRPAPQSVEDYGAYRAWWAESGKPVAPEEWASAQAVQEGQAIVGQLFEIQRLDGSRAFVMNSASPVRDASGKIVGSAVAIQDITGLREAERALRESERRYRELFDTSQDGLAITDMEGHYLQCNRAYLDLLGYQSVDELRGRSYEELTPRQYHELEARVIREQTLARGYSDPYEKEYLRSTGERVPVSLRSWLRFDADGTPAGMWVMVRDITERKRAEEALQSERNILHTIMENTRAHLAYLDRDFNFVTVNSTYAEGAGYSREQLIGRGHFELFPDAANQAVFERVRDSGEPIEFHARPFEFPDRPELGVTYWDWTLDPVVGADGRTEALVLSLMDVTQQVRASAEIESLSRFPRENPAPVLRVARDGTVLYANPGSSCLLAQWGAWVGQRIPSAWQQHIARVLETGVGEAIEAPCNERTLSLTIVPVVEKGYATLYGLDITDLKAAAQALQRQTERLQGLRQLDQAVLTARSMEEIARPALQRTAQLLDCTCACITLVDREAGQMSLLASSIGGEVVLDSEWRAPIDEEWARVLDSLAQGETYSLEDVQQTDAAPDWWWTLPTEQTGALVFLPLVIERKLIGSLNIAMNETGPLTAEQMDIAEELAIQSAVGIRQVRLHEHVQRQVDQLEQEVRVRTQALRESEARFRAIFEGAGIGMAVLDAEGRVEESNPALQELLGCGAQELRGKPFTDFSHPDDLAGDRVSYEKLLADNRDAARHQLERRVIDRDGRVFWLNVTMSLVPSTNSEPSFAIVMMEDVTERKRVQEALIQSEKLAVTGRLAASLTHEISNPLQSVIGSLELVEDSLAEGNDADEFLQLAMAELERVVGIVGQLRDLSQPSPSEPREPADVGMLVDHVLALTRKQCHRQGVELVWEEADHLPSVTAAPHQIQQVFLNLALNAIEAMPAGGRLQVRASPTDNPAGVCISFADTGAGINSETAAHLFEPFYTTKADGMGLGLYVSHSIVREHGGHIEVEGSEGQGSTFTVWLPT